MKTYIDCGSGVAGDMLLGAMVGLGLSIRELEHMLKKAIPMKDWGIAVNRVERQGWPGHSLVVKGDKYFGSPDRMKQVVRRSGLPKIVRQHALEIFDRLVAAEIKAHGGSSKGEFDQDGLGLLDTLVDVLGTAWGFWRLGIGSLSASILNTGRIAPATAQMLKTFKIPVYSTQSQFELATPTGVAILSVLAAEFAAMNPVQIQFVGYGAGEKDIPGKPNILAIYQGEALVSSEGMSVEPVVMLETVMDDMDPRLYPHVTDLLMKAGALDAWWVSAGMKKGRPGIAYSILCQPKDENQLARILFQETTTLGIRRMALQRWVLPRRQGGMRKVAQLPGGGAKNQVEYELARQKALSLSIPLRKLLK